MKFTMTRLMCPIQPPVGKEVIQLSSEVRYLSRALSLFQLSLISCSVSLPHTHTRTFHKTPPSSLPRD